MTEKKSTLPRLSKINWFVVTGIFLILGALTKLAQIAYSTPTSDQLERSAFLTRQMKVVVCGDASLGSRTFVDPCNGKDVRFRAIAGQTTISVYGLQRTEDIQRLARYAKSEFEKTDLMAVEVVFLDDLASTDAKVISTIRFDKEKNDAKR